MLYDPSFTRTYPWRRALPFLAAGAFCLSTDFSRAIDDFPGYTPETNDLFSTWTSDIGQPVVRNTSPNFIGAGLDFSGIGYGIQAHVISRAFVTPLHVFSAEHTSSFPSNQEFYVADNAGSAPIRLGYGSTDDLNISIDHSVGTLTTGHISPDAGITTYAVLDLGATSNYVGLNILEVGHGDSTHTLSPRVGASTILSVSVSGASSTMTTTRPGAPLQGGDSGGPTMTVWTDPNGAQQLTMLGTHYATDQAGNTTSLSNFFGSTTAINAANAVLVDEGFAMRLVGNASTGWTGSSSSGFSTAGNWTAGSPLSTAYVAFNAASAAQRTVDFSGTSGEMRGLLFGTGEAGDGFTFQNGTLRIGRGGIGNYSEATQAFSSNLAITLTDHQYWDAIHGGLSVAGSVNLNGKLLVVQGDHDTTISGVVSGSGPGFSKYGLGTLTLDAAATYTGKTWIYGGTVDLGVNGALPSGGSLVLANNETARLQMNGKSMTLSSLGSVVGLPGAQGTIDLGAGGLLTIDQASGTSAFSGRISGGATGTTAVRLLGSTTTNEMIALTGSSDYLGQTSVERGNVYFHSVGAAGASGSGNETIIKYTDAVKPTVRLGGVGTMNETIIMRNSSTAAAGTSGSTLTLTSPNLDLTGTVILQRDTAVANKAMSWTLTTVNSVALVSDVTFGDITGQTAPGASNGANTLIFQHFQNSAFHLDGVISNGDLATGLAVSHRGLGTIEINGANTYTGATTISANRVIVGTNALSGQAGAFGNATGAVTVGNQNLSFTTGLYAANGVTIGRGLAVVSTNTTGVIIGAENNASATYSGTISLARTETIFSSGTGSVVTFSNAISGTSAVAKQGAGVVVLSGSNVYSGGTKVQEGRLKAESNQALSNVGTVLVSGGVLEIASGVTLANSDVRLDGGRIEVNGTLNAMDFQAGTLSGSGILNAALTLDSLGDVIAPGNSPGAMTIGGSQTWTGFTYQWEVNDFTGGSSFSDLLAFTGSLTLGGSYELDLVSLTPGNQGGDLANFAEAPMSWTILTAAGGIAGFDAADWTIDPTAFHTENGWTGHFSLAQQGDSLVLSYSTAVPEPGTAMLVVIAGGSLLACRNRRNRSSGDPAARSLRNGAPVGVQPLGCSSVRDAISSPSRSSRSGRFDLGRSWPAFCRSPKAVHQQRLSRPNGAAT